MSFASRISSLIAPRGRSRVKAVRRNRAFGVNRGAFLEPLEARLNLSAAFPEFVDPHPVVGNQFGAVVVPLSTGNVVITSPFDDAGGSDAGAVYLFNGANGTLISTLRGSHSGDNVGSDGVTALGNGNYVIASSGWDNGTTFNAGAATWGSGTAGVAGIVSAANSLVGVSAGDSVGNGGVTALTNGNYVVRSSTWSATKGAVTWGSGVTGIAGAVSASNSLVGTTVDDQIGSSGVTALTNGNYLVRSERWDNGAADRAGAVTWGSGTTGITGVVSSANSLVGSTTGDAIGASAVTTLSNGNYVVSSSSWDNGPGKADAGAVTWGSSTSGVAGTISALNSLVGNKAGDALGSGGVTALSNGNYVIASVYWDNDALGSLDAGAATWGSGTTGVVGTISAFNSLVGSKTGDNVSNGGVTALTNGNYVVASPFWDNSAIANAGAATWGSGTSGVVGLVSSTNSLVGTTVSDRVGNVGVTALSNGNYVVASSLWLNGTGAATWGMGASGIVGAVSTSNSLVGSQTGDSAGSGGVTALTNGNYVVTSTGWDNGAVVNAGAATWGSGTTGRTGTISASNSLVGDKANDNVGAVVTALSNGNYVVSSTGWDNGAVVNAGATTWGNGTSGVVGILSVANSLVGSTASDGSSGGSVIALGNGNYVVRTLGWDNGAIVNAGAATWGNGTTGITGTISVTNSLVGSKANDSVANLGVTVLSNGNYVVAISAWDNGTFADAGAATWGSGATGVFGAINASNSAIGTGASSGLQAVVLDNINNTYFVRFLTEGGGRVRVGSQLSGFLNHTPTNLSLSNSTIPENQPGGLPGTIVGTFSTVDQDPGDVFTYSLVAGTGGADNFNFSIDPAGHLMAPFTFNYEVKNSYSIRVRTRDQGGLFFEQVFTISVTNVNEPPAIAMQDFLVPENTANGVIVGTVVSSDLDVADTKTFSITLGNSLGAFAISAAGVITVADSTRLDYETNPGFYLQVKVTDGGGLFASNTVSILLTNVNEAPTNTALSASSIPENLPVGTTIGAFTTSDPDHGNSFIYTLVSGTGDTDNASFSLDPAGQLRSAASFDFETRSTYSIRVRSTDQGGLFVERVFPIAVTNVNEAPTITADVAAVTVDEGGDATNSGTFSDIEGNTTVVVTASIGTVTQNNTNGTWSWSLNAADGPSGPLTVSITARDSQNATAIATFIYTVDNVLPTISLSGNATVDEGSAYTLHLGSVTDPGQDTITCYRIDWGDGVIDSFTGNPADTTATHTYTDGPSTQTYTVTVTDEDGLDILAGSLSVTVNNVAPTAAILTNSGIRYGTAVTAAFADMFDPSIVDTAAGLHFVFSIDTDTTGSITYADSSTSSSANFGILNAGSYTVYARIIDKDGGSSTYTTTITVNKADAVFSLSGYAVTYDGTAHSATGTAIGVMGEVLSGLNFGGTTHTDAIAAHADIVSFTDVTGNYNDASLLVTAGIAKANAVVTVSGYSGKYDAASHGATGTAFGVGGADLGAGLSLGSRFTDAPGGTAHWSLTGGANYYDQAGDVAIAIAKADATVSVAGYSGIYDAVAHGLVGTAHGVNGEPLGGLVLETGRANAGTSTVGWTFTGDRNYRDASGTQDVVIAQRPITVTADSQTKSTGQADPDLTYRISAGSLVGDDGLTGRLSREPGDTTGTYAIRRGTLDAGPNYAMSFAGADLVITVATSSLSGTVFVDFNNDGQVDFGEQGIAGATVHLTGTDDLGRAVDQVLQTDLDGAYVFRFLRPGNYRVNETQPAGYAQGTNTVGTVGGTTSGDAFAVTLAADLTGLNYNFGERPAATGSLQRGQTAGIGFWNNKNGQALIKSLNNGPTSTQLGNWLAVTLPNLYGATAGACSLAGKTNAQVAAFYQSRFVLKGTKVDAQVLASALSVYVTNATLDSSHVAERYGFTVTQYGFGATGLFNVGSYGSVFGVANNTQVTVLDLLFAVDDRSAVGVLFKGDTVKRLIADLVFGLINEIGGI
ncbi:Cadherin domain-containing protein [Singulisphaera sp. GP187]|uniref:cadherin domain-containing protein n=1 Tax=Singulisphaera sp. GP187 TaxID=1882752 RepID=UPI00092AA35F|nr:cadherin domain-containing protein [Singulisphaera sp. GP187]SIO62603.1 Cadherin domain-containing protein [Singulisphaera sp. GP187]